MRPLADDNVDDGRLIGSQNAQRDPRPDAVGPELLEYLSHSPDGFAVPADNAVADEKTRCCPGSIFVELDNDGSCTAMFIAQRMHLNADIAARNCARCLQPVGNARDGPASSRV